MVELKKKAVELSFSRDSVTQVCRELNIPTSVLSHWRRESNEYGNNSFPGRGNPKLTDQQREIVELKKKLRDSELENQKLKKAVSIFPASDRKNLGS
nr:hypothetical protein [Zobellia laminariae]